MYRASPQEQVELKCPVLHCGKSVHIVWCKVLDTDLRCHKIRNSEHIQINKTMLLENKLVSVLRFRKVSVHDSGVYSCKEENFGAVGHFISVRVSGIFGFYL